MDKLFLLDAYALIYRSYYAFMKAPRINSKGLNTSCVMGFCNTLNEILTKEKPTHIAVAFDHGKTFRHEAFPAYKAQREETPEDIKLSVPIIKNILEAYHIPILQVDGFEADDIIGTVALKAGEKGMETYMLTPDKDYAQLVRNNVFMFRPRHGGGYEKLGVQEIEEKYSITSPLQVIDLLALMGDSADNFPGCPGVGEKTAIKLINEFGSVEGLIENSSQVKGKLREKVEGAVEDIRMSKFLATIRTDVPVEIKMEDLKRVEPDNTKLDEIFTELEFKSFANRVLNKPKKVQTKPTGELDLFGVQLADSKGEPKNASFETIKTTSHSYKLIDTEVDAKRLYDYLLTFNIISLDTETTSTAAIDAELVGLSFAVKEKEAFYVAIPANREEALKIVNIFKPLYENPEILKVGQNIKYDIEVLMNYGIEIQGKMFDTMLAHYLIQPELYHNMDYLAEVFLNYQTIHIEELIGPKGKNQKSMRDLAPSDIYEYAAEDADITLRLKNVLEPKLKEIDCEDLFWNVEMPLVPVLVHMEMTGVCIDTDTLKETSEKLTNRLNEIEHHIYELAGESFNIASPRQVGEILFGKMKIVEKPKKTKTGQYVTSEEVLQQLRIAETEKYAHVTFFFNGGEEEPNVGEDRVLIPSPKVATYDLQPEMSAELVTDKLAELLDTDKYDMIILNFANPDMVGHTGVLNAAVKAMETVDACVGRIVEKVLSLHGTACITADHGNLEKMLDETTGQPYTAHTTNQVPFLVVSDEKHTLHEGILADIAPTLLELLKIKQPAAMTGKSLLTDKNK